METPEATPEERPERETSLTREALGFVPGIGTALDVADVKRDIERGDYVGAGIGAAATAVGAVPVVGRFLGKGVKALAKSFRKIPKADETKDVLDTIGVEEKALDGWRVANKTDEEFKKRLVGRQTELEEIAKKYRDNPTDEVLDEYRLKVDELNPIKKIQEMPELPTDLDVRGALGTKVDTLGGKRTGLVGVNRNIEEGTRVASRLDINGYTDYNKWIATLTVPKTKIKDFVKSNPNLSPTRYARAVHLKNVDLKQTENLQKQSLDIATGASKRPHAVMEGDFLANDPKDVYDYAKEIFEQKPKEWVQVGYNPIRAGFFYERGTGIPIESAEEIVQVGPLVLAKNVVGGSIRDYFFNKGGDVMEKQMEMAFMNEGGVLADDGVERDPVSGNEVPSGSMAEEVRDDVPAMLSEGEYVVPADVVRYHGIEKFEDLRDEAKIGLQRMEADGRIGGQPVEEQDELPFSLEELEVTEAYRGGIMGFQEGGDTGTYETAFGQPFTPNQRYGSMGATQLGFQLRNFTNPKTGKTVTIPFFNGKPMQYIPPDFTASDVAGSGGGTFDSAADERSRQEDEAERARINVDRGMSDRAYEAARSAMSDVEPQPTSFADFNAEDWQRYNSQQRSILAAGARKLPLLGYFQGLNEKAARAFAVQATTTGKNPETGEALTKEEMDALNKVATTPLNKSLLESLQTVIDQQKPDFLTYEQDRTISADPNVPTSAVTEGADVQAGGDFFGEQQLGELGSRPDDASVDTVAQKAFEILNKDPSADAIIPSATTKNKFSFSPVGTLFAQEMTDEIRDKIASSAAYNNGIVHVASGGVNRTRNYADRELSLSSEDLDNLATMAYAEAAVDGDIGMGAVANSILNRWEIINNPNLNAIGYDGSVIKTNKAGIFGASGNTMSDILFAKDNKGVFQYSPVGDGRYNQTKQFLANNPEEKQKAINAVNLGLKPSLLKQKLETETDLPIWKTLTILESTNFLNQKSATNPTTGLNNKADLKNHTYSTNGSPFELGTIKLPVSKPEVIDTIGATDSQPYTPSSDDMPFAALEQNRTIGEPLDVSDSVSDQILYTRGFTPATEELELKAQQNAITEQNLKSSVDTNAFRDSLRNIDFDTMTTKDKFIPAGGAMNLPSQPDFQPSFVMDYGFGTAGSPEVAPATQQQDFKLYDYNRFKDSVSKALEYIGLKDPISRPLPTQTLTNLPSGFNFSQTQLSDVPKQARKSLAQQTSELMTKTAPDQIAFEDRPVTPEAPASITAGGAKGTLPQVDTTTPFQDFAPLGERKVTDAKQFLKEREATSAAEQAVKDALSFTPKVTPKKKQDKPAEETISQDEYKKRVKDARTEEYAKARKDADEARDSVLQQGGSVQEAFDAAQTAFTGFTPSGEFVGPTDPGTAAMMRFSKGGLASRSKKTKPKKRNIKKGLGGKMAT